MKDAKYVIILKNYPNLGILRGDNLYEALDAMEARALAPDPIYFVVGDGQVNTPAADQSDYDNTDLAGLRIRVEKNGQGTLHPNYHYQIKPGGGILLLNGMQFGAGEEWTIIIY